MKASGVKPPDMSMTHGRVPANRERTRTCTPATYCTGRASSHWPSPLSASAVAIEEAASASTVRTVALGVTGGAGGADHRHGVVAARGLHVAHHEGAVVTDGKFDGGTLAVEGGGQGLEGGVDVSGGSVLGVTGCSWYVLP